MSSGKNKHKKRKRSSPPLKSQIGKRLEKLRGGQRDLWGDDDDDDDDNEKLSRISKNNNYKSYIVLSDSDEEKPSSSKRRSRSINLKTKLSQNHTKNATCLICSILSQLSSYNCCSEHLSSLKNHSHAQQQTMNSQWLPEQVMILPMTNEIVERYLNPEQIHQLRTQNLSNRKTLTRKSTSKSTMTLDVSEPQPSGNFPHPRSPPTETRPLASTIVVEPTPDITIATDAPSTSVINNAESITIIDIDQSSIQTITIDDIQQETTLIKANNYINKQIDPWTPISDEIDAALEQALDQIDSSSDTPVEFTPTTVRRTETEFMAARLPKIPLKQGRFRQGKPILDRTTSNAANEYRPLAATSQSPPITSSVITINVRSPPAITNVEQEESNRSENIVNNDHENIFTQDETILFPTTTRTDNTETELSRLNETQRVTSSTTNDRTTPSRISFRMNPDGTRVSISRPPLSTNPQSPLINSLRRTSTDVTPIQPNTKQV